MLESEDLSGSLREALEVLVQISDLVPGSGSVLDRVRAQQLELETLKAETGARQQMLRDLNHRLEETTDLLHNAKMQISELSSLVPGEGSLFNRVSRLVEKSRKADPPSNMRFGLTAAQRLERIYHFRRKTCSGFIDARKAMEENDFDVLAAAARWETGWRPSSLDSEE